MNPRTLREMTLKGFEIMVKESQPWTIMASYNQINGVFTQQNYDLLTTILRDEWGFKGVVMTDWGYKEGTVAAVKAGNDLMEAGLSYEIDRIIAVVKDGSLPISDVDRNVKRVLQYIVKTHRFNGFKYSDNPDLRAHAELVRKSSAEAMVLLRNQNNTLPLKGVKEYCSFRFDIL
jgi:beta-glucosidase